PGSSGFRLSWCPTPMPTRPTTRRTRIWRSSASSTASGPARRCSRSLESRAARSEQALPLSLAAAGVPVGRLPALQKGVDAFVIVRRRGQAGAVVARHPPALLPAGRVDDVRALLHGLDDRQALGRNDLGHFERLGDDLVLGNDVVEE